MGILDFWMATFASALILVPAWALGKEYRTAFFLSAVGVAIFWLILYWPIL